MWRSRLGRNPPPLNPNPVWRFGCRVHNSGFGGVALPNGARPVHQSHVDDKVDSNQQLVDEEVFLSGVWASYDREAPPLNEWVEVLLADDSALCLGYMVWG